MKMRFLLLVVGLSIIIGLAESKKYQLTADKSVPAARGQVDLGHDKNGNTKVEIKVSIWLPRKT